MKKTIWNLLKYFSINENWGKPKKISGILLFVIDNVRKIIGLSIRLSSTAYTGSGHSSNSYHYKGMALDGYIEKSNFTSFEVLYSFISALEDDLQIKNYALGYYPWWKKDNNSVGIHFDVREKQLFWVSPSKGVYNYYTNMEDFLNAVKNI